MASTADTPRSGATGIAGDRTPAQVFAYLSGAVLVLVGLIGFIADSSFETGSGIDGDKLLGIFEINGLHNIVHIASGLLLLAVAPRRPLARLGVLGFGVVYGLVTVIGLIDGEDVLGLLPVNGPDNVLHIALTATALFAAFASPADDRRGTA